MSRRKRRPPRREFLTPQHLSAHPSPERVVGEDGCVFYRLPGGGRRQVDSAGTECRCGDQSASAQERRFLHGDPCARAPLGVIQA